MATTHVSEDAVGKKVVRGDETVGRVVDYEHGTAHVDPDPGITDTLMAKLGWNDAGDDETYPLQEEAVEDVTDDEIRIRRNL